MISARKAGALLLGLSTGCGQEPVRLAEQGMEPSLVGRLDACEPKTGSARDWCAVEVLTTHPNVSGLLASAVCLKLDDRLAADKCLEFAVRHSNAPAGPEACEAIQTPLLLYSCRLAAADRLMTEPMDTVLAACRAVGPLVDHCLAHVGTHRLQRWQAEGREAMFGDLEAIAKKYPQVIDNVDFGAAMGMAAGQVGRPSSEPDPCMALPHGAARGACLAAQTNRGTRGPGGGR